MVQCYYPKKPPVSLVASLTSAAAAAPISICLERERREKKKPVA